MSGVGVLGTGAQLCDPVSSVPARLCSGVSGSLLTPVSLGSGLHLPRTSAAVSILCLPLARVSICMFLHRKGVVCVRLQHRVTVARAERGGWRTCGPCGAGARLWGAGRWPPFPAALFCSPGLGAARLPRGLSSTCSSHTWPWWWAELAAVGGLEGSGVGLMGSGGSSRVWSPPPGMSGSGVRWTATHLPLWSGRLPSPLPLSLHWCGLLPSQGTL